MINRSATLSGPVSFEPHNFRKRITCTKNLDLRVVFSARALEQMETIVDLAPEEVSWLGLVEVEGKGTFFISEVYVVEQRVTGTRTRMSEDGIMGLIERLAEEKGVLPEEINRKLKFWGHSHVRMSTNPSPQDDAEMETFGDSKYFIRLIANKHGEVNLSVFLSIDGEQLVFDKVPWSVRESLEIPAEELAACHAELRALSQPLSAGTSLKLNRGRKPARFANPQRELVQQPITASASTEKDDAFKPEGINFWGLIKLLWTILISPILLIRWMWKEFRTKSDEESSEKRETKSSGDAPDSKPSKGDEQVKADPEEKS